MVAIVAADIKVRGSVTAGAAGNTNAFGGPDTSLGKYIANADLSDATLHSLFDAATGAENAASTVEYQCVFIYNSNGANALENAVIYISGEVVGGAEVALGVDPTAASPVGAAGAQAVQIANKTTAPAGVAFTLEASVDTLGEALALGNIPAGNVKAVWIRRTLANTAAVSADGLTLTVQGDTGAA